MVIESLVPSFFGGLLALLVAYVGMLALLALKPADLQRPEQVHLSLPVLMFAMVVTGLAGILFGAIPALYVSRADAMSVLKQGTASQRSPARLRRVLVIGEVGLAVVLVIGAAFMIHSLVSAWRVDPGFRAEHVRTMHFSLPLRGMQRTINSPIFPARRLPGVKAASFSDGLPVTRIRMMKFTVDGQPMP